MAAHRPIGQALAAADNKALAEILTRNIYGGAPGRAGPPPCGLYAGGGRSTESVGSGGARRRHFALSGAKVKSLRSMDKTPWSVPVAVEDIPDTGLHMEIEAPAAVRARRSRNSPPCGTCRSFRPCSISPARARARMCPAGSARWSGRPAWSAWSRSRASSTRRSTSPSRRPAAAARTDATMSRRSRWSAAASIWARSPPNSCCSRIDPYPRKEGVQFAPPKAEEGGEHPFAALATAEKEPGERRTVSGWQAVNRVQNRLVCGGPDCMVAALHRQPVSTSKSIHAR